MNRTTAGRYLLRGIIAAALFFVGFQLERHYQAKIASDTSGAISTSDDTIVLLGGSMAVGLGPAIQSYLAPDLDARVVESTQVMLASDQLPSLVSEIVAKHRPRLIVVQVGLSESTQSGAEWKKKASTHLAAKDGAALAALVGDAIRSERIDERKLVFRYVVQERETILKADLAPELIRAVDARLVELSERADDDPEITKQVDHLVVVGRLLENLKTAGSLKEAIRIAPEKQADQVNSAFDKIVRIAKEWPGEIERVGSKKFLNPADRTEFYLRHWFFHVWKDARRSGEKDGVAYFSRNPEPVMKIFGWAMAMAKDPQVRPLLKDREPKAFWRALTDYTGNLNFDIYHDDSTFDVPKVLRENLQEVLDATKDTGVRIVLLQYPNRDLEMVTSVGRDLGLTVIESGSLFEKKIEERGRDAWFIDKIGSSGHLTEEGLAFYGRFVAERLNQELRAGR